MFQTLLSYTIWIHLVTFKVIGYDAPFQTGDAVSRAQVDQTLIFVDVDGVLNVSRERVIF